MPVFDPDAALTTLGRRVAITRGDTGQSRRVANFLLACWNARDCGGVDVTDLWMVDRTIADDILSVARLNSIRHEYPTADGDGPRFEQLVADWRPQLSAGLKAGRA